MNMNAVFGFFVIALLIWGVGWIIGKYRQLRSRTGPQAKRVNQSTSSHRESARKVRIIDSDEGGPPGPSSTSSTNHREGGEVIKVKRREIPYWKKRGWVKKNGNLEGYYRTQYGGFRGRIEGYKRKRPDYYIINPPHELKKHPHWNCFRSQGNGEFKVHFSPSKASDVGSGIQAVEEIIKEAFERRFK